jgi:hypothetical protein
MLEASKVWFFVSQRSRKPSSQLVKAHSGMTWWSGSYLALWRSHRLHPLLVASKVHVNSGTGQCTCHS